MMIVTTQTTSSSVVVVVAVVGCVLLTMMSTMMTTTHALRANGWQKRLDRALLQVDGVTPEGRFRSLQRALQDPELRTDLTQAVTIVREQGFGKGHPEVIELLWPEGTQARRDLEAINALSKQLPERRSEFDDNDDDNDNTSSSSAVLDLIRSTQEQVRFGDDDTTTNNARTVAFSLLERVRSKPKKYLRLAENLLRNMPVDVESPSYEVLGKYSDEEEEEGIDDIVEDDNDKDGTTQKKKKSFLTVPPLEIRRYDAFQTVSVPLRASSTSTSSSSSSTSSSSSLYTLQNMGTALTEIFSYLELGNNSESTVLSMTTPFFISDTTNVVVVVGGGGGTAAFFIDEENETNRMFVKLPMEYEVNPPHPVQSSNIILDEFPDTVLATVSFAGIITEGEMKRQKVKLLERIETTKDMEWKIKIKQIDQTKKKINVDEDGDEDEDEDGDEEEKKMKMKNDDDDDKDGQHEFLFLQYNAPGTLPWRRRNEIALVMERKKSTGTTSRKIDDDADNKEEDNTNMKEVIEIENDLAADAVSAVSVSHSASKKEEEEKVEDDDKSHDSNNNNNDNDDSTTTSTTE